jgi:hypothetical protein
MFLNSFFKNNKTYTATVQTKTKSFVNGVVTHTWTTGDSANCILWRGGMSDSFISEKDRADVSAVIIVKPTDIRMNDVPDDSRIKLTDSTITVAINKSGGYAEGTTTIVVDGISDSLNNVKRNDTFIIAGESGSPTHTVVSTSQTNSVTTGITFTTGIAADGVADNAVLTITQTIGYFSVISPDNIGQQDKVLMIPLREYTDGTI